MSQRLAHVVTPLVLESLREEKAYLANPGMVRNTPAIYSTYCKTTTDQVRMGLGLFQWLFWQFVVPMVVEWMIDWYFSPSGAGLRRAHEVAGGLSSERRSFIAD